MARKKGFTLIELIIAMGIASLVLVLAYNIFFVGIKGYSSTQKSFSEQVDIRYAIETSNNAIRFASVGFIVTEEDFKPEIVSGQVEGLVKPWNYLGLGPDGKSLVHYKYISTGENKGNYDMDILAEAKDNVSYGLQFAKPTETQESKIIRYILEIKKEGKKSEFITTELEAINAIHVIDWSDANIKSVALAYRTEETPEINKKPVAAMAMVLDTSGSMNNAMDGSNASGSKPSRISQLKSTLNDSSYGLFSILEENDVFVSILPFSNNGNIPHDNYSTAIKNKHKNTSDPLNLSKFYNVKENKGILEEMVDGLNVDGGTNTGDGIRRAYYQLLDFNHQKSSEYKLASNQLVKNYVIVLVDGVTTFGSLNVNNRGKNKNGSYNITTNDFITDNKNILDGYIMGTGSPYSNVKGTLNAGYNRKAIGIGDKLDPTYGEAYVNLMGNMTHGKIDQAFVIGYSNKSEELKSLTTIARALKIPVKNNEANEQFKNNDFVFVATDKDSLKEAFEKIGSYVNEELWQVHGPKLNP